MVINTFHESGVFRDGNDLAYAYMYWGDAKVKIGTSDIYESRYHINRAFTDLYQKLSDCKMISTPKFLIDDEAGNVKDTDKKTSYFATAYENAVSSDNPAYINLIQDTDKDGKRDVAGYKKDLNIKFTGSYLDVTGDSSWSYSKTYQFRVMSPILEGEAIAANNLVEVSATGRTKLYKEDIWAKTYNNDVKYDIFRKSADKWYRDDIKDVTFTSGNPNVFEVTIGTPKDPTGSVAEGNFVDSYIEVEGVTENTAKLNVAIEDIWGYTLKDQVDIKTTLNLGK